ncbi:MAG: hypothetical protein HY557_07870 [Euryarchaeota archaeon]|nr:hypothetical protein [Euryarchaeota archaeon]
MADEIVAKHGTITLEQLAEMQPGMARLMVEYSQRFWTMYYAAKASNWALAKYMHSEMMKLGRIVPVVRPKYAEGMEEFERDYMGPLLAAIDGKDWTAFEAAYRRAIEGSDHFHDKFAKPFIRFRLPPDPPPYLEFDPDARPPK